MDTSLILINLSQLIMIVILLLILNRYIILAIMQHMSNMFIEKIYNFHSISLT